MDIGNMIYFRRNELGMTLEQIGQYVGVSKSTVKKWEDGDISNMRRDRIAKLAKILKLNPVSLITGELVLQTDESDKKIVVTEHEEKLIIAYRNKPEMQSAVDTLLGINNVEYINIPAAARSESNEPISSARISKDKITEIENAEASEYDSDL